MPRVVSYWKMDELLSSGMNRESVSNREGFLITLKVRCRNDGRMEDEQEHIHAIAAYAIYQCVFLRACVSVRAT